MTAKALNIAVVSDIHLGHKRNHTEHIVENLEKAFPDNAETAELDLIFLAGDVFDGLLSLPDESVVLIDQWILKLLRICQKHDILLRVLAGTPSHDWDQSKRFEALNNGARIHAKLEYVRELSIEYIAEHGIHVLYVPDEWEDTTEKTLTQVRELMASKGLERVDYAIMHGQFEYQLPEVVKAPKHSSQAYLELVDKLIFIGHVHVFSRFDRIVAQGSFDRLSHGEESPKGHVRARVRSRDDYELVFVENEGARKFITIECRGLTLQETLDEIACGVANVPDGSFVRVSCQSNNPILNEMDHLVRLRPCITWSKIVRDLEEEARVTQSDNDLAEDSFIPITITRDNVAKLVLDRLRNKVIAPELLAISERVINEMR